MEELAPRLVAAGRVVESEADVLAVRGGSGTSSGGLASAGLALPGCALPGLALTEPLASYLLVLGILLAVLVRVVVGRAFPPPRFHAEGGREVPFFHDGILPCRLQRVLEGGPLPDQHHGLAAHGVLVGENQWPRGGGEGPVPRVFRRQPQHVLPQHVGQVLVEHLGGQTGEVPLVCLLVRDEKPGRPEEGDSLPELLRVTGQRDLRADTDGPELVAARPNRLQGVGVVLRNCQDLRQQLCAQVVLFDLVQFLLQVALGGGQAVLQLPPSRLEGLAHCCDIGGPDVLRDFAGLALAVEFGLFG